MSSTTFLAAAAEMLGNVQTLPAPLSALTAGAVFVPPAPTALPIPTLGLKPKGKAKAPPPAAAVQPIAVD